MRIDLKDPESFTIESLKKLITSEDDTEHTQFRVTEDGILFLSKIVGNQEIEGLKFRLETNVNGNGYVGENAAKNEDWVSSVYKAINENWPNPTSTYIDSF
jgi:hypothetical protein